jgi:hypothetical protein
MTQTTRQQPFLGSGQRANRLWKAVFSARSALIAAHETIDTATEERCFQCGPCLDVISRTISECSAGK